MTTTISRFSTTVIDLLPVAITLVSIASGLAAAAFFPSEGETVQSRNRAPQIEPYGLGMGIGGLRGLVDLSTDELRALDPTMRFRNERICHAPAGTFAGMKWEVTLGAVDGRIYKISAVSGAPDRVVRDRMAWKARDTLRRQLGPPTKRTSSLWLWDTEDGNVVLNVGDAGGLFTVVVTITSREVREFSRVR